MPVRPTSAYRHIALLLAGLAALLAFARAEARASRSQPVDTAAISVYPVAHPRGLMVTTGGWPYCLQVQALARRSGYTLICGKYYKDGYTGYGLRSQRHLDWGDPAYLASLATKIESEHERVGGELVLIGVSYSGFGIATLASHHPELRPNRLIVIDSFLDLTARRAALVSGRGTGLEIDQEVTGSGASLEQRTVAIEGLARLVRSGTQLTVIWSTSPSEQREFAGATCDKTANAGVLASLASSLNTPVDGWVTQSKHGHDLWDSGRAIISGTPPGHEVVFEPEAPIPAEAVCP